MVKKNIKPDEIKTTFADITTTMKKSTDDIADIYSHLGVWVDPNPVTATIANIKQEVTDIKNITDKVKIPHEAKDIKGLSYVVHKDSYDYIQGEGGVRSIAWFEVITGIYRISVCSEHQFNIKVSVWSGGLSPLVIFTTTGVNGVLAIIENEPTPDKFYMKSSKDARLPNNNIEVSFNPVDPTVVRSKANYVVEYLSPI